MECIQKGYATVGPLDCSQFMNELCTVRVLYSTVRCAVLYCMPPMDAHAIIEDKHPEKRWTDQSMGWYSTVLLCRVLLYTPLIHSTILVSGRHVGIAENSRTHLNTVQARRHAYDPITLVHKID